MGKKSIERLSQTGESLNKFTPIPAAASVETHEMGNMNYSKITLGTVAQLVGNAALCWGTKLGTFPKGRLIVHKVAFDIAYVSSGAESDMAQDIGLGTVIANDSVAAVIDGTATFEDIVTGQTGSILAGVTPVALTTEVTPEVDLKDGSTTAKSLHLNVAATYTDAETITFSGDIHIWWSVIEL